MLTYEKYAEIRDKKGLKDTDVARMADIPQATFSEWKHGKYSPKRAKMAKIEKVLGLSVEIEGKEYDYDELMDLLLDGHPLLASDPIRKDEAELLKMYNSVNRAGQKEIRRYAEYICTRDDLKKDASEGSSKIG